MINDRFPLAKKVAVDIPSGLPSDETNPTGEFVRADYTVQFTAPKRIQCLPPSYELMGQSKVANIGSPDEFCETNPIYRLRLTTPDDIRDLFAIRPRNSNKELWRRLVVGGSSGKRGAPAMTGLGSYRSGAGLVTVAIPRSAPAPAVRN